MAKPKEKQKPSRPEPAGVPPGVNEAMVRFLEDFYSRGQLEILYCTYTDNMPIKGMTKGERIIRIKALEYILNKSVPFVFDGEVMWNEIEYVPKQKNSWQKNRTN